MVGTVDVLLGNLEDAVKAENKEKSRQGLVEIGKATDFGKTQLWTRVNSLDSPWGLDDLVTLVTEIGDKLDVVMVRRCRRRGHPLRRPCSPAEAKAGLDRPILVHAILETAAASPTSRRSAAPARACRACPWPRRPRCGPPDEDHARRRRPPRLPRAPGPAARRPRPAAVRRRADALPAGPVALPHRPDGRRVRDARDLPLRRSVGTSRTPSPARTSSATRSSSAASARGSLHPV